MKFFVLSLFLALAAASVEQSEMQLHPYSCALVAEDEGVPVQEFAAQLLFELAVPAVMSQDVDPTQKAIVDKFVDEGVELDPKSYSPLGDGWKKLQRKLRRTMRKVQRKEKALRKTKKNVAHYRKIRGTVADPFAKQARHGLTPLEVKYMGLFRKYVRLHQAYRRSCVGSRFYLRLNKYHWKVLLAADKRLQIMLKRYGSLRNKYHSLGKRASRKARKSALKSYGFLKNIITLSKNAADATSKKVQASEAVKQAIKDKAAAVGQKMLELRDQVGPLAEVVDDMQNTLNKEAEGSF